MDQLKDVIAIDLEVTTACSADCGFCPREAMPDRKAFISLEVVRRLADDLRGTTWGSRQVVLCGIGEPTLHPQLDAIVQTLKGAGLRVEMTTHGGRMDSRRFEELVGRGVTGFHFSLNAATAETHRKVMRLKSFDAIVANLQEILQLRASVFPNVEIHLSFVVCTLNEHEAVEFVESWRPRGPTRIWLHALNNRAGLLAPGVAPADLDGLARRFAADDLVVVDLFGDLGVQGGLCKIARSLIFVSAEGEMRLCAMDYRRVTSYGNVMRKGLAAMHEEKLRQYLAGQADGFCRGCDFCPSPAAEAGGAAPRPSLATLTG
ncbi:MAG TPA: radical SAM protein [Anaeromyxobacteraceae bacterium]|nr:radical SAM protein [Anaeromyxobacteraceae bacterium]